MSLRIDVDAASWHAASAVFGDDLFEGVENVLLTLSESLAGTAAMAGSDPVGVGWAGQYDEAARATTSVIGQLLTACTTVAALLQQTGFNHGAAESASDPSGSATTAADTATYIPVPAPSALTDVLSASGGSTSPPHGWGMVVHAVGYVWPNGHPDRLKAAAEAWEDAAWSLDGQVAWVSEALASVVSQSSPEVESAVTVCTAMGGHLTDAAAMCRGLAGSSTALAQHVTSAHHTILHELKVFLEWTAGIEIGGGLLGLITGGLSEVAAQAAEFERMMATAREIKTVIEALETEAAVAAEVVAPAVTMAKSVSTELEVINAARTIKAVVSATEAAGGTARGAEASETAEAEAVTTLEKAAAMPKTAPIGQRLSSARTWASGKLPGLNGPPNELLVKRAPSGVVTNYAEYDSTGAVVKRVDLTGRAHGGVPTPHVVEYAHDVSPTGQTYVRPLPVRPATPEEIP